MFKCGQCGRQVGPRVKQHMLVVETRPVLHRNSVGQVISKGTETAKEIAVCPQCALVHGE